MKLYLKALEFWSLQITFHYPTDLSEKPTYWPTDPKKNSDLLDYFISTSVQLH